MASRGGEDSGTNRNGEPHTPLNLRRRKGEKESRKGRRIEEKEEEEKEGK